MSPLAFLNIGGASASGLMAYFWAQRHGLANLFIFCCSGFLAWVFDPTTILHGVSYLLTELVDAVETIFTNSGATDAGVTAVFNAFRALVSSGVWSDAYGVCLYLLSPIVSPAVCGWVMWAVVSVWCTALCFRVALYIKGHLYMASN